ncbi:MAG TPA: hypothetical protein VG268_11930 [Streptosporangiaceae bacterium]|jgi:hypothetical protein|nr:hypothetical protein [Streptosporangiaceae bacterium]
MTETLNPASGDVVLQDDLEPLLVEFIEVRARALDDFSRTIAVMAEAMAKRTGLSRDDLRVRTASGAVFGAILGATAPWDNYRGEQINADLFQRVDEALGVLEESLRL